MRIHSQKDERYVCQVCRQTFRASQGTPFHGLRTAAETVTLVVTLLSYGCPLQAIVHAFGFDERTVKDWMLRTGTHCQSLHHCLVLGQPMQMVHIQADEIKVRCQGRSVWMALVMMVSTRLWLGGVVSERRDLTLIRHLLIPLRQMALCSPLLVCVDGLRSYVTVVKQVFRTALPRLGRSGRCALVEGCALVIAQVVKSRLAAGLLLTQRIVQGSEAQLATLLAASRGGTQINTAYIERLNASFRQRLASLARRTRAPAKQEQTLSAGMWLVGCLYNFCDPHRSLRIQVNTQLNTQLNTQPCDRCCDRTPAMASGLTNHIWTPYALLSFPVPPPRWSPPKQPGRPSNETKRLVQQWCS